ncbi:hypothetical protein BDR07DRAFT_434464 [Suillus spraguei]|nr:hypothetical protein BDR07DRAFT_434464 [Suillus spraguei]
MTEAGLEDIQNLERVSSGQGVRLAPERDTLLDKLKIAYAQLTDAKQEEDSYVKVGFTETRTSLKVSLAPFSLSYLPLAQALQERFDDQLVTLRLTKESVGEVQERLQSANGAILVACTPMPCLPAHLLRDIGSERKPGKI